MESFFSRYRNLLVLVGVLSIQVIALATQVKRPNQPDDPSAGSSRLIRVWAVAAISPLEKAVVNSGRWAYEVWQDYLYLHGVRQQNLALQAEIDRLRLQQVRLRQDAEQAHRLQALFDFKEQYILKTVAAQVIGSSGSDLSRTVYIDKGTADGLQPDMAVITPEGIVGKVINVYPGTSQVLLISDTSMGVGAILEESRLQGIIRGAVTRGITELQKILADEKVQVGERVLTSGGDGVFPKGLPIGTVTHVGPDFEHDPFLGITVKPAANLARLEEVLVITETDRRRPEQEESEPRRAADILAQRLPSLPSPPAEKEKKSTAASGAAATPPALQPAAVTKPADKPATEENRPQ